MSDRIAYSPAEFAALFGKDQSWAYRKIYAKQLKIITSLGNMMIPASEVDRVLGLASYEGMPVKTPGKRGRGRPRKKIPQSGIARYLNHRRNAKPSSGKNKKITAYSLRKKQVFRSSNTTRAEILNKLNKNSKNN